MPQWAGSCWYFLRYIDPDNDTAFADPEKVKYWMPVDLYVAAEHAVLHLLYARFWHKFLYDLGVVNTSEPFQRLVNQGMILGKTTKRCPRAAATSCNPDDIVRDYGADAMRGLRDVSWALGVSKPWATAGLVGVGRFLSGSGPCRKSPSRRRAVHWSSPSSCTRPIKGHGRHDTLNFNTAISAMMILSNELARGETVPRAVWEAFIRLLAPYAPHLAEELWERAGRKPSVGLAPWPAYDKALTLDDTATIVVQVNGKLRDKFDAPTGTAKEEIERRARERPKVREWIWTGRSEGDNPCRTSWSTSFWQNSRKGAPPPHPNKKGPCK
jgi:leucyl-tRNA synthetase